MMLEKNIPFASPGGTLERDIESISTSSLGCFAMPKELFPLRLSSALALFRN
jgi:hypothetical protein